MFRSNNTSARAGGDNYETCPADLRFMVESLPAEARALVWDPFFCSGFSGRYLERSLGCQVVHTSGVDFFSLDRPPAGVTAVVSNPPFSKKRDVIEALLEFKVPFRLILPTHVIQRDWFTHLVRSTRCHSWTVVIPNSEFVACVVLTSRLRVLEIPLQWAQCRDPTLSVGVFVRRRGGGREWGDDRCAMAQLRHRVL